MARSVEQYRNLLLSLLPPGNIWNKELTGIIAKLFLGFAYEFNRVDARVDDLLTERDSRYVDELLEEFEAEYGIPEPGLDLEPTTERRRNVIHSKVIAIGDQDKDYFEAIAAALGYTIDIEEFAPAWADVAVCGDYCGDQDNLFKWVVWIDLNSIEYPIDVNITELIDAIKRYKPAHTEVFFRWKGAGFSRGFSRGFNSIPHYDNRWAGGGFSPGFSSGFSNNVDYFGVNYTGGFSQGFSIGFNRYSGGGFSKGFSQGFSQPN